MTHRRGRGQRSALPRGEKRTLRVLASEAKRPLADVVAGRLGLAIVDARTLCDAGSVWLDGRRQRDASRALRVGQRVVVHLPAAPPNPASLADRRDARGGGFELAWRDAQLAVVVKPAGLPSIPPREGGPSLAGGLRGRFGDAATLLHRLDREASGLLLVSLGDPESRERLARQVREHRLERGYLAIATGILAAGEADDERLIDQPIAARRGQAVVAKGPGSKAARTRIRVLARGAERSLLAVELDTGRLHQIRAHLAHLGHPLLGDARYGGPEAPRLALHAHRLGVAHPSTGERLEIHSPLPAALRQLLPRAYGERR